MRRFFALLLTAALLCTASACGKTAVQTDRNNGGDGSVVQDPSPQGENPDPNNPGTLQPTDPVVTEPDEPTGFGDGPGYDDLAAHRQAVLDSGAICGVIFLGYLDYGVPSFADDPSAWFDFLGRSGYAEDFDFLSRITTARMAETADGSEVYAFFPLNDDARVAVNGCEPDWETSQLVSTGEIFTSGSGEPFLVRCNVSEIFPDTQVTVTDGDGRTFTWSPSISLRDGSVALPEDNALLYDATVYAEGQLED